ncbi:MAG: roadblock/LC7 domain-containing protein [Candidatus Aenigmatarchaeota archaeon]
MELKSELEKILIKLKEIGGVKGSVIAKAEGLLVASTLPSEINSKIVAALAAAIIKSSNFTAKELGIGELEYTIIKSTNGNYVCFSIDSELVFSSLLYKDVNLGMVIVKMEKAIKEIKSLLLV